MSKIPTQEEENLTIKNFEAKLLKASLEISNYIHNKHIFGNTIPNEKVGCAGLYGSFEGEKFEIYKDPNN